MLADVSNEAPPKKFAAFVSLSPYLSLISLLLDGTRYP